jgi:hypothetical protein
MTCCGSNPSAKPKAASIEAAFCRIGKAALTGLLVFQYLMSLDRASSLQAG